MAKEEHDQLVAVIRGVHEKLRHAYAKGSGDENVIWEEHCKDVEIRSQYAQAMLKLATTVWNKNNTRISWVHKLCREYFYEGKMKKILEKNYSNLKRGDKSIEQPIDDPSIPVIQYPFNSKISMLDVGSCYNPFRSYEDFDCLAVDLTPACEDVYQCDFLQLEVVDCHENIPPCNPMKYLAAGSFHVVLFSLVLEYLPSPQQRFKFCQTAWSLLQINGLLLIITPDSKSQNHNAPMMRSWRLALESIGFRRIAYEKQTHIHCMAFIKTNLQPVNYSCKDIAQFLYIPQDFNPLLNCKSPEIVERTKEEDENVLLYFGELPYHDEIM